MVELLNKIKRVQALAEIGLEHAEIHYDADRYEELNNLAFEMMEMVTNKPLESLKVSMMEYNGYKTPKVDVRGVVLNNKNQVLLVKEKVDDKWSIPGGFADVMYSPKEIAEKEVWEEAGIKVKADRLVAVYFNERHNPADKWSIYKLFISCAWLEGIPTPGSETQDARFFDLDTLPPLSEIRNTEEQIMEVSEKITSKNLNIFID